MFDLLNSTIVNKFIPKKTFYERTNIATSVKDEFVKLVDRITWTYKLSEDTLNINKTEDVEEIEVFDIDVKNKKIPKNVIKTIIKAIPYKILFVIRYNDEICYGIDNYYTEWDEIINFNFSGFNLEIIYQNIVKAIIKEENNQNNFETIISNNTRKNELELQINVIKNKIKSEKQFNRKVELNQKLRNLEKEMEELINDKMPN